MLNSVEWKNSLVKSCQENTDGPENNLRREGCAFIREPANIGKIKDNFFLNRTVLLWNDLPVKVKETKSLNGFKAGLDVLWLFSTGV